MDCKYYDQCVKRKCLYCADYSLFDDGKKKSANKSKWWFEAHDDKVANSDKSWEDLEEKVAKSLNKIPTIKEARRSRASGALWFEKGDIVDEILHPECKERAAEKSFSVKREWLEKAKKECAGTDKTMCLPFRFKGDDKIYCIFEQNDIAELITTMKTYIQDNEYLRNEIKILKEGNKYAK